MVLEPEQRGFHARPDNRNPRSAIIDPRIAQIETLGDPPCDCPYRVRAMSVKIRDAKWSTWVTHTTDPNRRFIFFPPSWRKSDLVQRIINVFNTCANAPNNPDCVRYLNPNNRLTEICQRNYTTTQDVQIMIWLSGSFSAGKEMAIL